MKKSKPISRTKKPAPKSSGGASRAGSAKLNQATTDEFQREGMGVAAKE
jgi:hypothetical protein